MKYITVVATLKVMRILMVMKLPTVAEFILVSSHFYMHPNHFEVGLETSFEV